MSEITGPNAAEAGYWATKGLSWIEHEALQDRLLAPLTDLVLEAGDYSPGQHVLDIGCGTGAHALAVAAKVFPGGRVLAVDVSEPFLARTEERAQAADLRVDTFHGDAQVAEIPGRFHAATSRTGVMFFDDPAAAFDNIARRLAPNAQMCFAAWAPVAVNPWWRIPMEVASARLGPVPEDPPNRPGPMGLADADFTIDALTRAGLADVAVTPSDILLGDLGDARAWAAKAGEIGPVSRLMRLYEGTEADAQAIAEALTRVLEQFEVDGKVEMPATINLITARKT
ncbi:MAG: methyltransferase domain-containing protein [Silicimonas sp.]|nr:methyltransferase domain-containing protein [Silicimonas sp.]